jgi:hypothetical protein
MDHPIIRHILQSLQPDVNIVDAEVPVNTTQPCNSGLEELTDQRASCRDLRPAVIYGFDSPERMRERPYDAILESPGVFYLKLPARLETVKEVLSTAARATVPPDYALSEAAIQQYLQTRIKELRHTCRNAWRAMEMNANRVKRSLDIDASARPPALAEFQPAKIERFVAHLEALRPLFQETGFIETERLVELFRNLAFTMGLVRELGMTPSKVTDLAFTCVGIMADIVAILERTGETEVG